MTPPLSTAFDTLRSALQALKPNGKNGFEGFLAVVLGKITTKTFRLASSGRQLGVDGQTIDDHTVAFEAKRYDGKVPSTEVLNKIASIAAKADPPDIWILGATAEVDTQTVETLKAASLTFDMAVLILDWPDAAVVPPLAIACAMASTEAGAFLDQHMASGPPIGDVKAALRRIGRTPEFAAAASKLRTELSEPTHAPPMARDHNDRWLRSVFGDRRAARAAFGQALSPGDGSLLPRPRKGLVDALTDAIQAPSKDSLVAVTGPEGTGKSWLLAQQWLSHSPQPLTVLVPAASLDRHSQNLDFDALLIDGLIRQTGGLDDNRCRSRWRRRLKTWAGLPPPAQPRFVICIDGLNQRADFLWPSWLDGAAYRTQQLGGVLIVTARQAYFRNDISRALATPVLLVETPEWTRDELMAMLDEAKIDASQCSKAVLTRLRNPRLLGIAFELLQRGAIRDFRELSVGRLLFEHIRTASGDLGAEPAAAESAVEFSDRLSKHAQEILQRIETQVQDDRLVFDGVGPATSHALSAKLVRVADGHFFRTLDDDPARYELTESGLTVALGLAVITALAQTLRNKGDVDERLTELLEPIEALDLTAEALLEALIYACLDDNQKPAIRAALFKAFVSLQNPPTTAFLPFVAAVRQQPADALQALFEVATAGRYVPNRSWLLAALRDGWSDPAVAAPLSAQIKRWLGFYTVSSEMDDHFGQSPAERTAARAELRDQIDRRIANLSAAEKGFLAEMQEASFNPGQLALDAITLLAGQPLVEFAPDLVRWTFANALNSRADAATDRFEALVRFNQRDWSVARKALIAAAAPLADAEASSTGQWARVTLLRATATVEDAAEADRLVKMLRRGQPKIASWRRLEDYCATDPCDPDAAIPPNVARTAANYRQISTSTQSKEFHANKDRHYFLGVLAGIARFHGSTAVGVHRRYIGSVLRENDRDLMLGVSDLGVRSALLTHRGRMKLLGVARRLSAPMQQDSEASKNDWVTSQYALFLVFPYLSGGQQLDIIAALPAHGPVLLQVIDVLKLAPARSLHRAFRAAVASDDEQRLLAVLAFAALPGAKVLTATRALVGRLMGDRRAVVRALAMETATRIGDARLLKQQADGDWTAWTDPNESNQIEGWYGSGLLVAAAEEGLIDADQIIDRIAVSRYSAIARLPGLSVTTMGQRLRTAAERALDHKPAFEPPPVEQHLERAGSTRPALVSLSDLIRRGLTDRLKGMAETPQQFHDRQEKAWASYRRFDQALTRDRARLVVDDVGFAALDRCVSGIPGWGEDLARRILSAPTGQRAHVRNMALRLARALSSMAPQLAADLYHAVENTHAYLTIHEGLGKIPLEVMSAWRAAENDVWIAIRRGRLDSAVTDEALAQEVLAALMAERQSTLTQYADDRLSAEEPVCIARGLMVLGLGVSTPEADGRIASFENVGGFIGAAAKAARHAFARDRWSRHWYGKMAVTHSGPEYWRLAVLLAKIVDARFDVWAKGVPRTGLPARRFGRMLLKDIENRVANWAGKRREKLLGGKPPAKVFLGGNHDEDDDK